MLRGNGGDDIFFTPEDRYRLYLLIQEGVERYGFRMHAFCLMSNHFHLAVQVGDKPLSRIMQNLAFRYARWINRRYERIGHLFQGRYHALLVDDESYLLELIRYIHLNPVRAGLVRFPEDYEWSSHNAYLGTEYFVWLTRDAALSRFGDTTSRAEERYAEFVLDGIGELYRPEFHRGSDDTRVLGEDDFLHQVRSAKKQPVARDVSVDEVIAAVATEYDVDAAILCSPARTRDYTEARGVAAWVVREIGRHTLTELAERMSRSLSAVSLLEAKVRERIAVDKAFESKVSRIASDLMAETDNNSYLTPEHDPRTRTDLWYRGRTKLMV